ncbi:MAG: class II aldolase/adducin family protein [Deltaproteobacteria bacterium]|nr:class II aldolase/adducin family protein [Deltaproteobacteria bacterium]
MSGLGAERALRAALVEISHRLHRKGWVANHDGNVSVRAGAGRFLATPTAFSKATVEVDDILTIGGDGAGAGAGKVLAGKHRVFSEWNLHATCYARPDVMAVVHAHPQMATGFSISGARFLERPFIAEAVVSLGPGIPTVPFAMPGAAAAAALAPFWAEHDAVLLANHGVITVGADLEQAYLRMELVEHLANIAYFAHHTGGIKPLPEAALAPLLEARKKAGLGPAARAPGNPAVLATAATPVPTPSAASGRPDAAALAQIIRDELTKALQK